MHYVLPSTIMHLNTKDYTAHKIRGASAPRERSSYTIYGGRCSMSINAYNFFFVLQSEDNRQI